MLLIQTYLAEPQLARTHVVLIPSGLDATALPAFPQWPFPVADCASVAESDIRRRVTLLPNPATFVIGGTVFGATSADVIGALNGEDASRPAPAGAPGGAGMPRMPRLALHLLEQRSYFPVFPAPRVPDAPLELSQLWHTGETAGCEPQRRARVHAGPTSTTVTPPPPLFRFNQVCR